MIPAFLFLLAVSCAPCATYNTIVCKSNRWIPKAIRYIHTQRDDLISLQILSFAAVSNFAHVEILHRAEKLVYHLFIRAHACKLL